MTVAGGGVTQGLGTTKLHVQNACGFWIYPYILLSWRAGIDDDGECDASIGDMRGRHCGCVWMGSTPSMVEQSSRSSRVKNIISRPDLTRPDIRLPVEDPILMNEAHV